jgi:endonuclease/exonuclease/phosphatase (EEP) superfamily protein YafD
VRVTLTTANVQASLSAAQARADLARATAGRTTVALVQEMWPRNVARLAPAGWGSWHPNRPVSGCRDNAVLWDRAVWRLGSHHAVRLHWAALVGNCAAVAVLVHRRTGLRLPVIGVHLLPHVEVAGRPRDLPRLVPFHRSVDRVLALARAVWANRGRVIVAGDWNVDWPADHRVLARPFPYRHFFPSFDSNWGQLPWTRPTHGSRRIDTVWASETRGLRWLDSDTLGRTWSDHRFVRVTLRVPITVTPGPR